MNNHDFRMWAEASLTRNRPLADTLPVLADAPWCANPWCPLLMVRIAGVWTCRH